MDKKKAERRKPIRFPVTFLVNAALALCLTVLAGCSGNAPRGGASDDAFVRDALYQQYENWRGVPYRLGGDSKRGVDCSALVQITYRDLFGLNLPRSTWDLSRVGKPVSNKDLRSGDLVFFKIALWGNHVGIYLADGKFMHASASRGVMISDLNEGYWRKHYWKSLRPLTTELVSR